MWTKGWLRSHEVVLEKKEGQAEVGGPSQGVVLVMRQGQVGTLGDWMQGDTTKGLCDHPQEIGNRVGKCGKMNFYFVFGMFG